ncbi:MAG TPA: NAD-dependent epimerase/dehydratase family protein [Steroidobacteraceae bacterium]|nr:NAD-dependent epimerase/dehydratase family protein [Steroidobacteraceae bacterium]
MNILITGADGFIGRALVARLLSSGVLPGLGDARRQVTLLDRNFAAPVTDARVRTVAGDFSRAATLSEVLRDPIDCVFHLASIPGGAAEAQFELGLEVNLRATLDLFERLREQGTTPKVVFASTIGVYGVPLPELIDESTLPGPTMSYGAHKYVGEVLLCDYSRRGWIDGRALRLPGIVARPPQASGMLSAFMSDIIRILSAGRPFVCPVASDGMAWWMSRTCVVENLLHAAGLNAALVEKRRVWLLPVLHASLGDVVAAIARVHGEEVLQHVTYQPNAALQAQFANLPPLCCPASLAAGFRNDGTLESLVQRALDGP